MRITALVALATLLACAKGSQTAQSPATIVYSANGRLYATQENPGSLVVPLTSPGMRAAYFGRIGPSSIVYGNVGDDASIGALHRIDVNGSNDVILGELSAGTWTAASGAWQSTSGAILLQASRLDGSGPAVLAIKDGAVSQLAAGRFLALAGNRVAYLANATSAAANLGDVRSVGVDGSANLALGGGSGDDHFHGLANDRLVFTSHSSGTAPELHIAGIDGSSQLSRAGSKGLLFSGSTIVAERSNAVEKVGLDLHVTPVSLLSGAQVLALLADGRVANFVKGAGVMADQIMLDTFSADTVHAAHQYGDRLVYTANNSAGSYLRSARVDGGSSISLSEGHGQELLFAAEMPGDRVLFYRTKAVEPGGWLATVSVAGGGEKVVGDDLTGTRKAADHDFGGLTKAGRLIFEAEIQEGAAPNLYVVEPGGEVRSLTGAGSNATLCAVLESQ